MEHTRFAYNLESNQIKLSLNLVFDVPEWIMYICDLNHSLMGTCLSILFTHTKHYTFNSRIVSKLFVYWFVLECGANCNTCNGYLAVGFCDSGKCQFGYYSYLSPLTCAGTCFYQFITITQQLIKCIFEM